MMSEMICLTACKLTFTNSKFKTLVRANPHWCGISLCVCDVCVSLSECVCVEREREREMFSRFALPITRKRERERKRERGSRALRSNITRSNIQIDTEAQDELIVLTDLHKKIPRHNNLAFSMFCNRDISCDLFADQFYQHARMSEQE